MFNQLPIFIVVNNQFLNPATNIDTYNFLLQKFNTIVYKKPSNQYFQALSVYSNVYYRAAIAFKFYFNEAISSNYFTVINNYIKQAFEITNQGKNKNYVLEV